MEASTTIRGMISGNIISVPSYQRAYSWETEIEKDKTPKQTNVFLSDLEDYNNSLVKTPYYFGHFLFEKKQNNSFGVIDGQQRLTTIVIFLSALFTQLKASRKLTKEENECYEDIIKKESKFKFKTVYYDAQLFNDFVIDRTKKDENGLETSSAKRIVQAFKFFTDYLSKMDEVFLLKMLNTIKDASCTTQPVTDESEAIQMFIFQNNRGKKPSNLEIIKAQFMFNVHLSGGEEEEDLIKEIKNRFEKIYKSISSIEYNINEDDILVYTLRVYFNSLDVDNPIDKINKLIKESNPIPFIISFTRSLEMSFDHLTTFFGKDEKENIEIHSLVTLEGFTIAIPFIIKAYKFNLRTEQICKLCSSLESIILRHRLIGTRANIVPRINDVYKKFTEEQPDIKPILDRIDLMKHTDYWWDAYWNNSEFVKSIQGRINPKTAKYLLWKYENSLLNQGNRGYKPILYTSIDSPELEHIAPQTPTDGKPIEAGYCDYDEEFINQYLDCLGNYLLISKSHNCSKGNNPFPDKRKSYTHLAQQREIMEMTEQSPKWSKELISQRKSKIIDFILKTF